MQIDVDPQEDPQNAPDVNYVVENPTLVRMIPCGRNVGNFDLLRVLTVVYIIGGLVPLSPVFLSQEAGFSFAHLTLGS